MGEGEEMNFTEKDQEEFERLSKMMIKFIKERCHPHCSIFIDIKHAEVLQGEMAFSVESDDNIGSECEKFI